MIKVSLIQTSQNRRYELKRFIVSLASQAYIDLKEVQLIFIDQEDNKDIIEPIGELVDLKIIKSSHCSLSHARNLGLPFVKGEIVGFPDDDCWYEIDTLKKVIDFFEKNKKYSGLTGKGLNENDILTHVCPIAPQEVTSEKRCAAISYTMFFRYCKDVRFNEDIGVGSPYNLGAGEETDYMLQLMEQQKFRIYYAPSIIVRHPALIDYPDKSMLLKKTYSYSRGAGYLMKLHNFSLTYYVRSFLRPLGGIIIYALKFDLYKVKKYTLVIKGLLEGFCFTKK